MDKTTKTHNKHSEELDALFDEQSFQPRYK